MKLLIVTQKVNKYDPILGFFHRWILEFASAVEKVTVICLEKGEYDVVENVEVLSLGKEEGRSKISKMIRFYKYIVNKSSSYDAVFVHMNPIYIVLGGLYWRMKHKKIGLWYLHKSVDWKLRIAEKLAHVIFTASELSCRLVTPKKRIVGHGIDTDVYAPKQGLSARDVFAIVSIGRISSIKNYETLIDAVAIVAKQNENISLKIVGVPVTAKDEEYILCLKEKVDKLGLVSRVEFVGAVSPDNVPDYLNNADLFVNQSGTGSVDKAVLEAMAVGVPVLTSNEAFKELLDEEFLFLPKNASNLAQKILYFIERRSSRQEIGAKLRGKVTESFNLKTLVKKIIGVYNE